MVYGGVGMVYGGVGMVLGRFGIFPVVASNGPNTSHELLPLLKTRNSNVIIYFAASIFRMYTVKLYCCLYFLQQNDLETKKSTIPPKDWKENIKQLKNIWTPLIKILRAWCYRTRGHSF